MNQFCGTVDYFGKDCAVYLEVEAGECSADLQMDILKRIFSNLKDWDEKIREFACDNLWDIVDEWNEETITKEAFVKRIGVPDIIVKRDGSVSVMYETDNMCTDHSIEVNIDKDGNLQRADIVG